VSAKAIIALFVVLGAVIAVLSNISGTISFLSMIGNRISRHWPFRRKKKLYTELHLSFDHTMCTWQQAGRSNVNHTRIHAHLYVTNAGPAPWAQIVRAYLKEPYSQTLHPMDLDERFPMGVAKSKFLNFEATPVGKYGENWEGTIVLIDQFKGKHEIKVPFKCVGQEVWGKPAKPAMDAQ
jgi:hypothetical protein